VSIPAAIALDGVGKRFTKYEDTPMLLSRVLQLRNRTRRSSLWALRGASFEIARGECVGVIGRNGSGKSTLLQMLAGVTAPTEGRVTVRGRVAPLISVGVGFHPELTGRENVYVNATILGLTRAEVDARFDEIVAFSEIGDFIDTPVKFYSSGMFVRLGFSVSVLAEPDVLLIDEVLAVGDLAFQMKCFGRMEELRASGTTIVIVTHNLNAVRRLCDRTIVVHGGEIRHDGDTLAALSIYHELIGELDGAEGPISPSDPQAVHAADFTRVELLDASGRPTRHVAADDLITVEASFEVRQAVADPILGVAVVNEAGVHVYGERWDLTSWGRFEAGARFSASIALTPALATGSYELHLGLASLAHERIAPAPAPFLFFVSGRPLVRGIADLRAALTLGTGTAGQPTLG
jgi:ABC-type polysaccharide/polyol phosphate transport system ATPase subunit